MTSDSVLRTLIICLTEQQEPEDSGKRWGVIGERKRSAVMEHLKQTGSGIRRLGPGHKDAVTQITARDGEGLRGA